MGYGLLILLNAVLLIRPAEVVTELHDLPLYQLTILLCVGASYPVLLGQLRGTDLGGQPITLCVGGLLAAVVLSHLSHGSLWDARRAGTEFGKVVLYYLLLVGLLDSPSRLRQFLLWLAGFTFILSGLALLHYGGAIEIAALEAVEERGTNAETGEVIVYRRLCSTGIFRDPNDLCLILVLGMGVCGYQLEDRRWGPFRLLWAASLGLFAYALTLTQSRGGFLALLGGVFILSWDRLGGRKTLALAVVALPGLLLAFAGRQTDLGTREGTSQARIQLWSESLGAFRREPLFGIGQGKLDEEIGLVAHNSFVHCYAELGFVGGTLFLAAFYLAIRSLRRCEGQPDFSADGELTRMRPYLLAMVSAYAIGMLSLTRVYIVPTYMVLGLTTAYLRCVERAAGVSGPRADTRLAGRLLAGSVVFLAGTYVFVRLFVRWG